MDIDAASRILQQLLAGYDGLKHLRVKKRGQSLIIYSGDPREPWLRARLTTVAKANLWRLSFPDRRGRWEPTPLTSPLAPLTTTLIPDFEFHLADRDPLPRRNRGRTYDLLH